MTKRSPFLFKRSNGVWYTLSSDGNRTVWKSTKCTNKREARRFLRAFVVPPTKKITREASINLDDAISQFLEYARTNFAVKTVELYEKTFHHLKKVAGDIPINTITPKLWDDYAIARKPGIKEVSLAMEQKSLKAFVNKLVEWRLLKDSPFKSARCVKTGEVPPKCFTKDDFLRVLSIVEEPWVRNAMIFSVSTGVRLGELSNLKWTDIDFDRKVMTIQSGNGFQVKGGRPRTIPLSETAYNVLRQFKHLSYMDYVFNWRGNRISAPWLSKTFARYVRAAGLGERGLHWHNLRSSFASWLVADGVPIYSVSKLLGHASVVITQKHYARLSPDTLHNEVARIHIDLN